MQKHSDRQHHSDSGLPLLVTILIGLLFFGTYLAVERLSKREMPPLSIAVGFLAAYILLGALVYVFFGWYPVVRPRIAALPSRPVRLAAKLIIANAVILLLYGAVLRLMGLTADLLEGTTLLNAALLVMGNGVFLLLDKELERLTLLWHRRFRKYFFH